MSGPAAKAAAAVRVEFLQLTGQGSTHHHHANNTTITLPLLLLPAPPPQEEVVCPITHEPIGSETYTLPPGFSSAETPSVNCEPPKQTTSLLTHPKYAHLLCMELMDCKHRFDARALVAHFLHNGLTCPMCRRGNADAVFDARATFKGFAVSNWVLHHPKLRAAKRRRLMAGDIMAALLLFDTLVDHQQQHLEGNEEEEDEDAERLLLRLVPAPHPPSSVPLATASAGRSRVQFRVRVWGSSMSEVYDEAEQQRQIHNSIIVFD